MKNQAAGSRMLLDGVRLHPDLFLLRVSIMKLHLLIPDEPTQLALGARLGQLLPQGVVYLQGDLGSGKTTLTRGLIQGQGFQGAVKSPTYTLVEPYMLGTRLIYHFDLYRLNDPEELELIGIRDYFEEKALCLIEWPQKGQGILPAPDLTLTFAAEGQGRSLLLQADSEAGQACLQALKPLLPSAVQRLDEEDTAP